LRNILLNEILPLQKGKILYLRRHKKKVAGEEYGYWSLVESIRTARGPRQRIVATISKLPDYDQEEQIGWEEIPWAVMACILVIARFCAPSSELQIADSWYGKTALCDLLEVPFDKINEDRLYRALDALLPHKNELRRHLQTRYGELFGTTFDFLFYDITSTYFEGNAKGNPQAKRGYSRDKRSDCPQVCIGLVASREGLPLAFEIFDGNRVEVTTTQEMIQIMESKYGKANRIWVMDRGMVSEDNLDYMRKKGARYLVGTPKSMLKKFEQQLLGKDWEEVQSGVEVRLCSVPDSQGETFGLCRSQGRREKENAILNRFVQNMEAGLAKMEASMASGKLQDRQKAERRIGRFRERNSRTTSLFTITVTETKTEKEKKLAMTVHKNEDRYRQLLENGSNTK
jgi:transposase